MCDLIISMIKFKIKKKDGGREREKSGKDPTLRIRKAD